MGAIRHFLPYLIVLYFIIRGNRQFLFFLAIPFLMFMSNSIFFENAKPFQIPGSLYYHLILIWIVLLWVVSKFVTRQNSRKYKNGTGLNVTDFCIIGLILISIIGLVRVMIDHYPVTTGIFDEFFIETSLLIAYFLIKDWLSNNNSEVVIQFFYSLVIVNSLAALLFLLHQGLHFDIYTTEEYVTEAFQGEEITRTFWFMPQFLFFSVVFLLVFKKKFAPFSIPLLIINLSAIIITYTLSAIIIALMLVILYFVLVGLKTGRLGSVLGNLAKYAIITIAGFFIMWKLLPANINFLLSRISEHTQSEYTSKDPDDLDVRLSNTKFVISQIDRNKKLFGVGPVPEIQSSKVAEMKKNTADVVWSGVIVYWGFLGLALFLLIFFFSSLKAFKLYLKSDGDISALSLMLLLYIISQFIDGFVSWTFLSGHGIAIGLWYFALLSALPKIQNSINFKKSNTLSPVYSG